jgi:hypothetical protein
MTSKPKKTQRKKVTPKETRQQPARSRPAKGIEIRASVEDDLLLVAEEKMGAESRWHRPRKQRVSLTEGVDWFKSRGPGYQTRSCER